MEKDFEYKEEYSWLTNICLNVTDACNLACRYCFVEQHPHYMTLDTAKQAVHFILNNLEKKNKKFNKNEKASVTYFGGEPTLMWDEIIVPLTDWVKENKYPIDFTITTNGTLLNEERIKYLKINHIFPLLSIDGDRYTQEYNRPCKDKKLSSFDLVNNNISSLTKNFPDITFRATIYADTVSNLFKNYMFAVKNNFNNVFFIPDERHCWSEESKIILKQEVHKIFCFMHYCFVNDLEPINFPLINDSFRCMLERDLAIYNNSFPILNTNHSCLRCGLGTTFGAVGYDGSIYGCQEQPSKNLNNIFYIGDIFHGIDVNKHTKLLTEYTKKSQNICENQQMCQNCLLKKTCINFGCPSSRYDLFQNFYTNTEIMCLWKQYLLDECIILNNLLVKQNNQNFKTFLDNKCNFKSYLKGDK